MIGVLGWMIKRYSDGLLDFHNHSTASDGGDTPSQLVKRAKEAGVKLIINTDSHHKNHLKDMKFGIAQARRGWAEKKDIINTYSLNRLLRFLKNNLKII